MQTASSSSQKPLPEHITEDDRQLLLGVRSQFLLRVGPGVPVFTTDAEGLWPLFLDSLPAELRQVYACNTCRRFVERYGGLVAIEFPEGTTGPLMWGGGEIPSVFMPAVRELSARVSHARVTGIFLSKETTWGTPVTGPWEHFAVGIPDAMRHSHAIKTAEQTMAEKREDYGMLQRGLAEFPMEAVRTAAKLLKTGDHLYRSEKVLGIAEWLLALHERRTTTQHARVRDHFVWQAVALAPPGFVHVRTSMIGTLLEDIVAGLPFESIKRKFAEKMHPLQYQRPTAAPSEGQVEQAEVVVAKLGVAGALRRRWARLDDVAEPLWCGVQPAAPSPVPDKVFGHLKTKEQTKVEIFQVDVPETVITWEKFRRVVLPDAEAIELYVGVGQRHLIALVTASDPDAPTILQWYHPVSWYVYNGGSRAEDFNLRPRSWVPVVMVCLLPPMWGLTEPRPHWGEGAILLLEGAKDVRWRAGVGGAFFPEQLRPEFHPVRKTLEAYARAHEMEGREQANACGLDLRKGQTWDERVRVTSRGGRALYRLERWD